MTPGTDLSTEAPSTDSFTDAPNIEAVSPSTDTTISPTEDLRLTDLVDVKVPQWILDDAETTTIATTTATATTGSPPPQTYGIVFQCKNGNTISIDKVCDGKEDCPLTETSRGGED